MTSAQDIFRPLIGLPAWQVRRGHGSFLTMEFGEPHLEIRQPRVVVGEVDERVKKNFQRRRVFVLGKWHFWVQYCNWTLVNPNGRVSSDDTDTAKVDKCLGELDGQILIEVCEDINRASCDLKFDLGGVLMHWPSPEFLDDDQWTVHCEDKSVYAYQTNGTVVFTPGQGNIS